MLANQPPPGSFTAIGSSFGPVGTAAGAAIDIAGLIAGGIGEARGEEAEAAERERLFQRQRALDLAEKKPEDSQKIRSCF